MPIYAYKCDACGHAKDVMQKMADPLLTDCPACGAAQFTKQLTAPGFQLKGTGWYATDFKSNGVPKPAAAAESVGGEAAATSGDQAAAHAANPALTPAATPSTPSVGMPATSSVASAGCAPSCSGH